MFSIEQPECRLLPCMKGKTYSERLKCLGLLSLECRREIAVRIQVYKILNDIDKVNKDKLFTMSHNIGTNGHQLRYTRTDTDKVWGNYFSKRVVDLWNKPSENTVMANG